MNGLELLREVRLARSGARQNVPFFIVTGFAERTLAGLALGLDVDAFLARPVKQQALNRHLIRTCSGRRRVEKSPAEAQAAYADVDLTAVAPSRESRFAGDPQVGQLPEAFQSSASVAVLDKRLVALENVPDGAHLARDAVNSAGLVLLKAGEEITVGLKAVLMSYAEIDESLAKVWVQSAA
jgi:CheY-like chemotaxis protein